MSQPAEAAGDDLPSSLLRLVAAMGEDLETRQGGLLALAAEAQRTLPMDRRQPSSDPDEGPERRPDESPEELEVRRSEVVGEMDRLAASLAARQQEILALIDDAIVAEHELEGAPALLEDRVGRWQPEWRPSATAMRQPDRTGGVVHGLASARGRQLSRILLAVGVLLIAVGLVFAL